MSKDYPVIKFLSGNKIPFYKADVRDKIELKKIFEQHTIDAVIHFAGLKAVGESVKIQLIIMMSM